MKAKHLIFSIIIISLLTACAPSHTLEGTITLVDRGLLINDVEINLSGEDTSLTSVTDTYGHYTFEGLNEGEYTITFPIPEILLNQCSALRLAEGSPWEVALIFNNADGTFDPTAQMTGFIIGDGDAELNLNFLCD